MALGSMPVSLCSNRRYSISCGTVTPPSGKKHPWRNLRVRECSLPTSTVVSGVQWILSGTSWTWRKCGRAAQPRGGYGMDDAFHDFYKDRRVFVTGHTGFKGSWLTQWLLDLGAVVK